MKLGVPKEKRGFPKTLLARLDFANERFFDPKFFVLVKIILMVMQILLFDELFIADVAVDESLAGVLRFQM